MTKHFTEKKPIKKEIIYLGTINYRILSGLIFGLIISFYLPFVIRKKNIDLVIVDGGCIWSPFLLGLKLFGISLLLDIRSLPIDKKKSILSDISFRFSRYIVDGITTITPELREILIKKYKIKYKKIGIWSSGVSKDLFNESVITSKNLIKKSNPNLFILLHHGTYSPTRGIENLIYSIAELSDSLQKNIRLILVGIPYNKKKDLSELCEKLKIKEYVEIIPPVEINNIPIYIQSADVGVIPLPPTYEWWRVSAPLKSLEYLALGKPIIATNIPFHQKIFNMYNVGVLLDTNDPKAIANAVTYLFQNKEKLIQMGRRGKEIVEKYYTWDHKALEFENFIKTIFAS
jgi:glycosyltransferase involved in cell wall biosynthesis